MTCNARTRVHDLVGALLAVWQTGLDVIAVKIHEWILRQHSPEIVEGPDGEAQAVCLNHWRPRIQPWPCGEVLREMQRWDRLQAGKQPVSR